MATAMTISPASSVRRRSIVGVLLSWSGVDPEQDALVDEGEPGRPGCLGHATCASAEGQGAKGAAAGRVDPAQQPLARRAVLRPAGTLAQGGQPVRYDHPPDGHDPVGRRVDPVGQPVAHVAGPDAVADRDGQRQVAGGRHRGRGEPHDRYAGAGLGVDPDDGAGRHIRHPQRIAGHSDPVRHLRELVEVAKAVGHAVGRACQLAVTRSLAGSMRSRTSWSARATQTASPPVPSPAGWPPTGMVARTRPLAGSTRTTTPSDGQATHRLPAPASTPAGLAHTGMVAATRPSEPCTGCCWDGPAGWSTVPAWWPR